MYCAALPVAGASAWSSPQVASRPVNERRKPQPRFSSGEASAGWRGPTGERQPIGMPRYSAESRSGSRGRPRCGSRARCRCGTRAGARRARGRRRARGARRPRSARAPRCAPRAPRASALARTTASPAISPLLPDACPRPGDSLAEVGERPERARNWRLGLLRAARAAAADRFGDEQPAPHPAARAGRGRGARPRARGRHRLRPKPAVLPPRPRIAGRGRSLAGAAGDGAPAYRLGAFPGIAARGERRGAAAQGRHGRHRGDDLDAVQRGCARAGARRDPPRAAPGRCLAVHRARPRAAGRHRGLAGPADAALAQGRRRLPPQSAGRPADRGSRPALPRSRSATWSPARGRSPSTTAGAPPGDARRATADHKLGSGGTTTIPLAAVIDLPSKPANLRPRPPAPPRPGASGRS